MLFQITIDDQEVNVIGAALAELPFKVSAALIQKLQQQVTEHQKEPEMLTAICLAFFAMPFIAFWIVT